MTDIFSKEKRSEIMSRIRSKWTGPERTMHGYLKSRKVRHKMHPKMTGNPDILLKGRKVVVFIDGDFWHGRDYTARKHKLQPFWKEKIKTNMERDEKNYKLLNKEGWKVLRLWEEDVRKRPEWCIGRIKA